MLGKLLAIVSLNWYTILLESLEAKYNLLKIII